MLTMGSSPFSVVAEGQARSSPFGTPVAGDGEAAVDPSARAHDQEAHAYRAHDQRAHDRGAQRRNRQARRRDDAIELWQASMPSRPGASQTAALQLVVRLAAADRRQAARDATSASAERAQAAVDRARAAAERQLFHAQQQRWSTERASAALDALTGAYRREIGFAGLDREIARATRTDQPLAVAFVDLVGLKQTNDSGGHAAGDKRLRAVADVLRAHLRPYDLVFRYGGDEFVCVLTGLTVTDLEKRFASVNQMLDTSELGGTVTVGLAELRPGDCSADLVARADDALYEQRQPEAW